MRPIFAACLTALTCAAPANAAETLTPPAYVDDRSSPDALVRSLYNAVNRREYARAWSYFSEPPAASFDAFVDGYADTESVDVATGRPSSDGAAGSVFHAIPVAIRATNTAGEETTFAGCYRIRAINPGIQDPPYRPLQIVKGALKPAGSFSFLANELPEDCDGQKPEAETTADLTERVVDLFRREHRADCNLVERQRPFMTGAQPVMHELKFRYDYESATDPERGALLFRFDCATYAYNVSEAYYLVDEYGEIESVSFAEPELDISYTDDTNATVKSLVIGGMQATRLLVNSEFDAATKTITSFSKWRGFGDAFSAGTWTFKSGRFVLTAFAVDAAYDDEQNPVDVLTFPQTP